MRNDKDKVIDGMVWKKKHVDLVFDNVHFRLLSLLEELTEKLMQEIEENGSDRLNINHTIGQL